MPDCSAQHILEYLFDAGPALRSGMGDSPLTECEIRAWMNNTGIELSAWESRIVKRLSQEYMAEQQRATSPSADAPWTIAPYAKVDPAEAVKRLQQHIVGIA